MKHIFRLILITAICSWMVNKNNAQYSEIGLGIGFTTYWGDLNGPSFSKNLFSNSGLAIQVNGRRMFGHHIGMRASFTYGKMQGTDANSTLDWQLLRNLSFSSTVLEFAVMGELYLWGLSTDKERRKFLPYLTIGLSAFKYDPTTIFRGQEVRLQPLGTEGQGIPGYADKYSLYSLGIPMGGGAKIMINETFNIGLEVLMRPTFTDYIDDVSTIYVNYDELNFFNNRLAADLSNRMNEYLGQLEPVKLETGSIRGGAKTNDYFFSAIVSFNFTITDSKGKRRIGRGSGVSCPTF